MTIKARIDQEFSFHPPPSAETAARHEAVRDAARQFAHRLRELVPPGVERDQAIAAAREGMFWANAGIACYPTVPVEPDDEEIRLGDDAG